MPLGRGIDINEGYLFFNVSDSFLARGLVCGLTSPAILSRFDPPESEWYQYEVFLRLLSPSLGTMKAGLDCTLSYSDLESLSFEA